MTAKTLIDRRQREAAALILSAIDLPAPMNEVAEQWRQAAGVCIGFKIDQALLGDRPGALRKARGLLDQLLGEAEARTRLGQQELET